MVKARSRIESRGGGGGEEKGGLQCGVKGDCSSSMVIEDAASGITAGSSWCGAIPAETKLLP